MLTEEYDAVFLGGGLAATLLLDEMRAAFPERVLVSDPESPLARPRSPSRPSSCGWCARPTCSRP
jgi:hypothetical protein